MQEYDQLNQHFILELLIGFILNITEPTPVVYKAPVVYTSSSRLRLKEGSQIAPPKETEAPEPQVDEGVFCSCVETARELGADLPAGDAIDLQPNTTEPVVGGVILLNYPSGEGEVVGHVAYIQGVFSEGVFVAEGNKVACEYTERYIFYGDKNIRGYYKSVL